MEVLRICNASGMGQNGRFGRIGAEREQEAATVAEKLHLSKI
jgi:hypothetical protein